MPGHPLYYELLEKAKKIHDSRNHDYAENENPLSNLKQCEEMGICDATQGVMIRMTDKWSRLIELMKGKNPESHESMIDTLIDMANYSLLMGVLVMEKQKKAEEKRVCPNCGEELNINGCVQCPSCGFKTCE